MCIYVCIYVYMNGIKIGLVGGCGVGKRMVTTMNVLSL